MARGAGRVHRLKRDRSRNAGPWGHSETIRLRDLQTATPAEGICPALCRTPENSRGLMVDGVRQRHRKRRTGRVGVEIEKAGAIRLAQPLNLPIVGRTVTRLVPGRDDEPYQPLLAGHRPGLAGGGLQCRCCTGSEYRQQAKAAPACRQRRNRARCCRKARTMRHGTGATVNGRTNP
jgi:hypothetical protein